MLLLTYKQKWLLTVMNYYQLLLTVMIFMYTSCGSKSLNRIEVTFTSESNLDLTEIEEWQQEICELHNLASLEIKRNGNALGVTGKSSELKQYEVLAHSFYSAGIYEHYTGSDIHRTFSMLDSLRMINHRKMIEEFPDIYKESDKIKRTSELFTFISPSQAKIPTYHYDEIQAVLADSVNLSAFENLGMLPFTLKRTNPSAYGDSLLTVEFVIGEGILLNSILDSLTFSVKHFVETQLLTPPLGSLFPEYKGLTQQEVIEQVGKSSNSDSLIQVIRAKTEKESRYLTIQKATEYPVATLYFEDSLSFERPLYFHLRSETIALHSEDRERYFDIGVPATEVDMDTLPTIHDLDSSMITPAYRVSSNPMLLGALRYQDRNIFSMYGGPLWGSSDLVSHFTNQSRVTASDILCGLLPRGTVVTVNAF